MLPIETDFKDGEFINHVEGERLLDGWTPEDLPEEWWYSYNAALSLSPGEPWVADVSYSPDGLTVYVEPGIYDGIREMFRRPEDLPDSFRGFPVKVKMLDYSGGVVVVKQPGELASIVPYDLSMTPRTLIGSEYYDREIRDSEGDLVVFDPEPPFFSVYCDGLAFANERAPNVFTNSLLPGPIVIGAGRGKMLRPMFRKLAEKAAVLANRWAAEYGYLETLADGTFRPVDMVREDSANTYNELWHVRHRPTDRLAPSEQK